MGNDLPPTQVKDPTIYIKYPTGFTLKLQIFWRASRQNSFIRNVTRKDPVQHIICASNPLNLVNS